jgi:AraC-like DNA-binding protein
LPGAEHLVIYHFVMAGSASISTESGETVSLNAGDIVVFPHGDPHRMVCGSPAQLMETTAVLNLMLRRNLGPLSAGGGGEITRFVCGYMACDPRLCRPILSSLPEVIKVNIRSDAAGQRLENYIRHLVEEAGSESPGSSAMLAKLSEALFVDTLRRYIAGLPAEQTGWLAGTRDPIVGKSLAILHRRPQHPWTIAELAREVGLSRSALVDRFSRYLSEPPMTYLARWRLQLAARALGSTSHSVAQIAADVGYESEAAFNRAFKREFGLPPARFRKDCKADRLKAEPLKDEPGKVQPTVASAPV